MTNTRKYRWFFQKIISKY